MIKILFGAAGSLLLATVFAATLSLAYSQSLTPADNTINSGVSPSGALTAPAVEINIPTNTPRQQLTAPVVTPSRSGLNNPTANPSRSTQLQVSPLASPVNESPLMPRSGTIR